MSLSAIQAIYFAEVVKVRRTFIQSVVAPFISTALYFVIFGRIIGQNVMVNHGIAYGAFLVPGLVMMSVFAQSFFDTAVAAAYPKFTGVIYELLTAPVSYFEVMLGYVAAAITKSVVTSFVILATAAFFVSMRIDHPIWMVIFLLLTIMIFSLLGFVIGVLVSGFDKLGIIPNFIISPLAMLGGCFYSIKALPAPWETIALFNPIVYFVSGFRWSFFSFADVGINICIFLSLSFLVAFGAIVAWILKAGYYLKS